MRDLNKVMLIGNLTRDPEIRSTSTGQTVASFAVACNRSWNDQQGVRQDAVEYVNIVAWGKLAEIVGQIYRKGRRTYIEGRLQTSSWEDKDTGARRYKTEVIASDLILLDRAPTAAGEISQNTADTKPTSAAASAEQPKTAQPEDRSNREPVAAGDVPTTEVNEDEINIEDIPF
ncbi:single-stranded DNA-binding protein [candidate division Kazan bacterium]|uniref:Single-stranded DNA-binding protein n=1 Tax=candidate division Kazan bacterium TaxID=2202143 RepID=A0A420ZBG4_UNCK3|nr:MAG: single-stranded DNA-binding protein [candidate division Kazan bacterium]